MNTMPATFLPIVLALFAAPSTTQRTAIPAAQAPHEGQVMRLYEVRDLVREFGRDYPAPRLGEMQPWCAVAAGPGKAQAAEVRGPSAAELEAELATGARNFVEVLKRYVEPKFEPASDRLESSASGTLVAHLMPAQHAWVEDFLRRVREFDSYIEIETRFIEAPTSVLESMGLSGTSQLRDANDLAALDALVKATPDCNLLAAPRLTTLPAQRASISAVDEFKFVADWSIEVVEPDKREIAVPLLSVIREGVAVDVRALPLDGGLIALELGLQNAHVRRPVRTVKQTIGKDAREVELTLAEAETVRYDATILLASGASSVVVSPFPDATKSVAVVVTARKVAREER